MNFFQFLAIFMVLLPIAVSAIETETTAIATATMTMTMTTIITATSATAASAPFTTTNASSILSKNRYSIKLEFTSRLPDLFHNVQTFLHTSSSRLLKARNTFHKILILTGRAFKSAMRDAITLPNTGLPTRGLFPQYKLPENPRPVYIYSPPVMPQENVCPVFTHPRTTESFYLMEIIVNLGCIVIFIFGRYVLSKLPSLKSALYQWKQNNAAAFTRSQCHIKYGSRASIQTDIKEPEIPITVSSLTNLLPNTVTSHTNSSATSSLSGSQITDNESEIETTSHMQSKTDKANPIDIPAANENQDPKSELNTQLEPAQNEPDLVESPAAETTTTATTTTTAIDQNEPEIDTQSEIAQTESDPTELSSTEFVTPETETRISAQTESAPIETESDLADQPCATEIITQETEMKVNAQTESAPIETDLDESPSAEINAEDTETEIPQIESDLDESPAAETTSTAIDHKEPEIDSQSEIAQNESDLVESPIAQEAETRLSAQSEAAQTETESAEDAIDRDSDIYKRSDIQDEHLQELDAPTALAQPTDYSDSTSISESIKSITSGSSCDTAEYTATYKRGKKNGLKRPKGSRRARFANGVESIFKKAKTRVSRSSKRAPELLLTAVPSKIPLESTPHEAPITPQQEANTPQQEPITPQQEPIETENNGSSCPQADTESISSTYSSHEPTSFREALELRVDKLGMINKEHFCNNINPPDREIPCFVKPKPNATEEQKIKYVLDAVKPLHDFHMVTTFLIPQLRNIAEAMFLIDEAEHKFLRPEERNGLQIHQDVLDYVEEYKSGPGGENMRLFFRLNRHYEASPIQGVDLRQNPDLLDTFVTRVSDFLEHHEAHRVMVLCQSLRIVDNYNGLLEKHGLYI